MAGKMSKPGGPARVEATRHDGDSRVNIPTAELLSFAEDQEQRPQTVLYPRDQSLDPQLVWKGKDQQDRSDLAVPAVPIYIQEQISPKAIIEDLRARTAAGRDEQLDLFHSDFNGMTFDERVEFYQHPMKWSNRMILGDSLLVMTSLAEKEGLKGQVQTIYLDPPYGIKFGSNWQVSMRRPEASDGRAEDTTRQPEQVRAFRDTWQDGINSYLGYLRDRLTVARDLLTESGSVFVQIGDANVHVVRSLLDEVFGPDNFCSMITVKKTSAATTELLPGTTDFVLWYARQRERTKYRSLNRAKTIGGAGGGAYDQVELTNGTRRRMSGEERADLELLPPGSRPFRYQILSSQSQGREKGEGAASWFPVAFEGREFRPPAQRRWTTNEEGIRRLIASQRVAVTGNSLSYVRYLDDFPVFPVTNLWEDTQSGSAMEKVYVVQTNTRIVERCVVMTTDPGDLVLDPTCGSGTTAYVAEEWGRRWITIDTSRVALALARTRLMSARYPYYLMADTPDGQRREFALTGQPPLGSTEGDIRKGFVYERVPHVTLKSIAQNPDIDEGMTRAEISAAIARHADTEVLYDRPYQDSKVVRVAGPFTVESLSPHRVVADGPEDESPTPPAPIEESGRFVGMILDNLRVAGVQNTVKDERLLFEALGPYPGTFLQGSGTYEENGTSRRVAVAIGPEYGTVGSELVREAAKEAVDLFDLLVVCGFAFDARAGEQARKLGRLTVLQAKMNPDLAMGDELLRKTRTGNLFTVFGQPDIDIRPTADGQFEVEIRGLDVFDPTTGEIRSHSTDDIAAWFIDTDYDAESFFVRHAYFTGAGDPYEKLRRALRAEIDEVAWASLYSTVSRPFPRPTTEKIAVKVINHYGDEILKVYGV